MALYSVDKRVSVYEHGDISKKVEIYPLEEGIDNTRKEERDNSTRRQKYTACMILEIYERRIQCREMVVVRE